MLTREKVTSRSGESEPSGIDSLETKREKMNKIDRKRLQLR